MLTTHLHKIADDVLAIPCKIKELPHSGRQNPAFFASDWGIIYGLIAEQEIMEAERLNALSALLADLTTREAELRRYL